MRNYELPLNGLGFSGEIGANMNPATDTGIKGVNAIDARIEKMDQCECGVLFDPVPHSKECADCAGEIRVRRKTLKFYKTADKLPTKTAEYWGEHLVEHRIKRRTFLFSETTQKFYTHRTAEPLPKHFVIRWAKIGGE